MKPGRFQPQSHAPKNATSPSPQTQAALQSAIEAHVAGRLSQAAPLYEQVLQQHPNDFQALHLAGTLAFQQERITDAVRLLSAARAQNRNVAATHMVLGLALAASGQPADGEKSLRQSVTLDPKNLEAWNNLGTLLCHTGKLEDAIAAHKRALELKPQSVEAWIGTGTALLAQGRGAEAVHAHSQALALAPQNLTALTRRTEALTLCRRLDDALADIAQVIAIDPFNLTARSHRLMLLNYLDNISPAELFHEHLAFGRAAQSANALASTTASALGGLLQKELHPPAAQAASQPHKLRVAFLSPDLRTHPVAFFLEPLLRHLPQDQFQVLLYHNHFREDATSERLRSLCSLWRNVCTLPSNVLEKRIREDAPDILVDLCGHTGQNRLALFARRLAPVQIAYLGYPNTTGLDEMDFRLTDAIADPTPDADPLHTESLVRFAPTAWAYDPPANGPEPAPLPCSLSPDAPVCFGSFNNAAKLSPSTLRLWAKILSELPSSRLLLKSALLDVDTLVRKLIAAAIDTSRTLIMDGKASFNEHLATYAQIDIALDPTPYNGTTTTCEALWMGRPVLTLAGDRHASRVGASLLSAVGHPEWIASSPDAYVALATTLANHRTHLAEASRHLRTKMLQSPLLDHRAQSERFAIALRQCWDQRSASA